MMRSSGTSVAALTLLCMTCFAGKTFAESRRPIRLLKIIAHRGVVAGTLTENSLPSLEETIRRGYTHIEVDVRCTKDGQPVCLHDMSLLRTAHVRKNVHDLTLPELRALVPEEVVPTFEAFCARCEGRINLMPDVKDCPAEMRDIFAVNIENTLVRHNLLKEALFIGDTAIIRHFTGKTRRSFGVPDPGPLQVQNEQARLSDQYFVFGHAKDFNEANVTAFHKLGLEVIVSINTFHYMKGDPIQRGKDDIEKMRDLGVDGLQIDSVYDDVVFQNEPQVDAKP